MKNSVMSNIPGGKCHGFMANWFTFPDNADEKSVMSNIPGGKCHGFVANWFTFRMQISQISERSGMSCPEKMEVQVQIIL